MKNPSFLDDAAICLTYQYPTNFRKIGLWAHDHCFDNHGRFLPSRALTHFHADFVKAANGMEMKSANALGKQVKKFYDCIGKPMSLKTLVGKKYKKTHNIPNKTSKSTSFDNSSSDDEADESDDEEEEESGDETNDDEQDVDVEVDVAIKSQGATKRLKAIAKLMKTDIAEECNNSDTDAEVIWALLEKLVSLKPLHRNIPVLQALLLTKAPKKKPVVSTAPMSLSVGGTDVPFSSSSCASASAAGGTRAPFSSSSTLVVPPSDLESGIKNSRKVFFFVINEFFILKISLPLKSESMTA
jgi:hypothetical protein